MLFVVSGIALFDGSFDREYGDVNKELSRVTESKLLVLVHGKNALDKGLIQ